jgi:hypothetical protein
MTISRSILFALAIPFVTSCKQHDTKPGGDPPAVAAKAVDSQTYDVPDLLARIKEHAAEWTGKQVTVKGPVAAALVADAELRNGGIAIGASDAARVDCQFAAATPAADQLSHETITVQGTFKKLEFGEAVLADCRITAGLPK